MNNYFDIVINKNSFYIVESSSKPKTHDSALETLKKMEFVVKNKLTYDSDHKDDYSGLSQRELFDVLKSKTSQIHQGYNDKQSKLNWLFRKIFSKEKEIRAVHTRIDNYIQPAQALPLPDELIREVTKHLGVADLGVLAQLNRAGTVHAGTTMVTNARELGYEGHSHTDAAKYIDQLFEEVIYLAKRKVLPKKNLSYEGKKLDLEKTLQNLKELPIEDLFTILSNEKLYSCDAQKIRKVFQRNPSFKITTLNSPAIKRKGTMALVLSAIYRDIGTSKLLLQYGADPNIATPSGSVPLHFAAQAGRADIVELLLKSGARVNERDADLETALSFVCGYKNSPYYEPNLKVVELLLQHGADPNSHNEIGITPLHFAAETGRADILELFLKSGARVNERDNNLETALSFACGYRNSPYFKPDAKIVELLLKHGADPNSLDKRGMAPLHFAAETGYADIVESLLKGGAQVNERAGGYNTPLAFAHGYGDKRFHRFNVKVIQLLIQYGADRTIPAKNGDTF